MSDSDNEAQLNTNHTIIIYMYVDVWHTRNRISMYMYIHIYVPSSKVMQLSAGQLLTRWAGLLLLPMVMVNTYSVQGWSLVIRYVSLVALERKVPTSSCPSAVSSEIATVCSAWFLVREVCAGKSRREEGIRGELREGGREKDTEREDVRRRDEREQFEIQAEKERESYV